MHGAVAEKIATGWAAIAPEVQCIARRYVFEKHEHVAAHVFGKHENVRLPPIRPETKLWRHNY